MPVLPDISEAEIAVLSRRHLEAVVAIASSSDETSTTVPSTEGQRVLSRYLETFFSELGAKVRVDEHANVIAQIPGRGLHADLEPLAFMIHLDTAQGTLPCEGLSLLENWDGQRVPYGANEQLQVSVANYPSTREFLHQDLLHGDGKAPFGLDDKLGLAHIMTLAKLLADHRGIPHRPILLIGRPDEEIGREEALLGLAEWLAAENVQSGYTVDGIAPFEVNVECFNGMGGTVRFPNKALPDGDGDVLEVTLLGVNTHGATAKAEGHRDALRLSTELMKALKEEGVVALGFSSDKIRDCDGVLRVRVDGTRAREALEQNLTSIVGVHIPRGGGWSIAESNNRQGNAAVGDALAFVEEFIASKTDIPLLAEDSHEFEGYTHPHRLRQDGDAVAVDFRIRDFKRSGLEMRRDYLAALAKGHTVKFTEQYSNMGSKLADRGDLVTQAQEAARHVGVLARALPIRGGTGVDPFLDRGVFVANLGTGYFSPESEKEFTSMQLLAKHALWLVALVQA